MSPFGFPVLLELAGRRCVVIGALPVSEGKVEGLLAGGATDVLVLADAPADRLDDLARRDFVTVERRAWLAADLTGAFLVVAHDPDPGVRAAIAGGARTRGALVNVVDDVPHCDLAMPALVRRGDLTLAVGTGGASPALARRIRERLEDGFGAEWVEVVGVVGDVRRETLPLLPDLADRARRWRGALDLDEATSLARAGRTEELRDRLRARLLGAEAS